VEAAHGLIRRRGTAWKSTARSAMLLSIDATARTQMPIGQVSIGLRMRPGLAFLAAGLCAALFGCSDPGIVTAQVKVQQAPASDSQVLVIIPRGTIVKVRNCTNGWCRVSWNNLDGYILAKNVRIGGSARRSTDAGQPGDTGKPSDDDTQDDDNVSVPDSSDSAAPM
jgi:uncharacterized protein YgiM (DUF1202 family)